MGLFELNLNIKDISLVQDLTIQDDEIVPGKKVWKEIFVVNHPKKLNLTHI